MGKKKGHKQPNQPEVGPSSGDRPPSVVETSAVPREQVRTSSRAGTQNVPQQRTSHTGVYQHEGQGSETYSRDRNRSDHRQEQPQRWQNQPRSAQFSHPQGGRRDFRQGERRNAPSYSEGPSASRGASQSPMQLSPSVKSRRIELSKNPKALKDPGTWCMAKILIESNHFALDLSKLDKAYRYEVAITEHGQTELKDGPSKPRPGQKTKIKNIVLVRVMNEFLRKRFPERHPSFDGKTVLYASRPLDDDLNRIFVDTDIRVPDDLERPKTFSIEVRYMDLLPLTPTNTVRNIPVYEKSAIQCINIILRNAPLRSFAQIGISMFKRPEQIISIRGGAEMYHGFYQSVVMGGRPLLNVKLVHKAFAKNVHVLDAFTEIARCGSVAELASNINRYAKKLSQFIANKKVGYLVPGQNKVIYRIKAKTQGGPCLVGSARQERIESGDTIEQYFCKNKRVELRYPELPLLRVTDKIKLPAELCVIEPYQPIQEIDGFQTADMIKVAATDTIVHRNNILARLKEAGHNRSPFVQEFGISTDDKFERTEARILPPPVLNYRDGESSEVRRGVWKNSRFHATATISKWAFINLDNTVGRNQLDPIARQLIDTGRRAGVTFNETTFDYFLLASRGRYGGYTVSDFDEFFNKQKANNYTIFFVIIPDRIESVYEYLKFSAETKYGLVTQCIKAGTIHGKFFPAANLMLKVNTKLGGVNHVFSPNSKPVVLNTPYMLIGADVTHPKNRYNSTYPSVACVIASHDCETSFRYNSTILLQPPTEERILDLKQVVTSKLLYFYRTTQSKPEKLIYLRDGVSEGQFDEVLKYELQAIKAACSDIDKSRAYNPAVVVIIVQKRHHTRIFPVNEAQSEGAQKNVPPGTCVDTNIVDPTLNNFVLVSHASIKGVARPTKYCTIYDDLNLTNDEIQQMVYYLCHMFSRCNRAVSYPAPTYYAHLGALRGKAYIKAAIDANRFDMNNLQGEMEKIQVQENLRINYPMHFT